MDNYEVHLKGKTILIVDDMPDYVNLLSVILVNSGYNVSTATDGSNALAAIQSVKPNLILLDVRMPGMDGYQTCHQLKQNQETQHIPVIFISALDEMFDKMTAFSVGGVDYITKPFHPEEILARVRTHLIISELQHQLHFRHLESELRNAQLQEALDEVKVLSGLLPICAGCKKIRDDTGYWHQVEVYIRDHSEAEFSHGICPECTKEHYPEVFDELNRRSNPQP